MANTSGYGTSNKSSASLNAVRQKQRLRRHLYDEDKQNTEEPSFSEPVRVFKREDSLANSIQDVLGPVGPVQQIIERDPNSWLGTSRNASTSSHTYQGQRGGSSSHKPSSSSMQHAQPKQSSVRSSQREMFDPERSKPGESASNASLKTSGQSYQETDLLWNRSAASCKLRDSPGCRGKSHFGSMLERTEERPSYSDHTNVSGSYNRKRQLQSDTSQRLRDYSDKSTSDSFGLPGKLSSAEVPSPLSKVANRERLQSADMPGAVEHIFKEMLILKEPLTAITTPNEFDFSRSNENRNDPSCEDDHDTLARGGAKDHIGPAASDSDSTDDSEESDDSDTESDDSDVQEVRKDDWNLCKFYPVNDSVADGSEQGAGSTKKSKHDARSEQSASSHLSSTSSAQGPTSRKPSRGRPSTKPTHPMQVNKSSSEASKSKSSSSSRVKEAAEKQPTSSHSKPYHGRRNSSSSQRSSSPAKQRPSHSSRRETESRRQAEQTARDVTSSARESSSAVLGKSSPKELDKSSRKHPKDKSPLSRSKNKSSNKPHELKYNVSKVTVASPDLKKQNKHSKHRVAEKKMNPRDHSPSSSSSDSSSESYDDLTNNQPPVSSASSSSEAESDVEPPPVFARSPQSLSHSGKRSSRERFGSSSSVNAKQIKLERLSHTNYDSSPSSERIRSRQPELGSSRTVDDPRAGTKLSDSSKGRDCSSPARSKSNSSGKEARYSDRHAVDSKQSSNKARSKMSKSASRLSDPASMNLFRSLWVRFKPSAQTESTVGGSSFTSRVEVCQPSHDEASYKDRSLTSKAKITSGRPATNSTGSETDQPIRRAEIVQVAQAGSSNDQLPYDSNSKRKFPQPSASSNHLPSRSPSDRKSKRRKREPSSPNDKEETSQAIHETAPGGCAKLSRDESRLRTDRRKTSPGNQHQNQQWCAGGEQATYNSGHSTKPTSQRQVSCQSTSNSASAGVASIVTEPDSSWPEQERLLKSDDYMREGKRLKHDGDACTDARTGRTKSGEALSRALTYFEAALCFMMNGYMLEMENGTDRSEGSTSRSGHSPTSMYHQTIDLLDYIRKMRAHDDQEETAFRRLNISCIRCQALLHLRVYKLKKDATAKYAEILSEQFKSTSKANRTPSPWHPTGSMANGQNVVSPVSPAVLGGVPSPYGVAMPGPSPVAGTNNCELVSSSTQVGKITSPATQNSVFIAPKMYEIFKHYHTIMSSLALAHDKWDQAENLQADHVDFFRNVDTLCGRSLMLHSSLRELATYNKVILHQLRAIYVKSPRE